MGAPTGDSGLEVHGRGSKDPRPRGRRRGPRARLPAAAAIRKLGARVSSPRLYCGGYFGEAVGLGRAPKDPRWCRGRPRQGRATENQRRRMFLLPGSDPRGRDRRSAWQWRSGTDPTPQMRARAGAVGTPTGRGCWRSTSIDGTGGDSDMVEQHAGLSNVVTGSMACSAFPRRRLERAAGRAAGPRSVAKWGAPPTPRPFSPDGDGPRPCQDRVAQKTHHSVGRGAAAHGGNRTEFCDGAS